MSSDPAETDALVQRLAQLRILPVATLRADTAEDVGRALVDAGLPCIEITFRAAGAAEAIRRARTIDGLLGGARTVLTPGQAQAAAEAGAAFAPAPGLNEEIVDCCRELGLPFFPGVATPTEVDRARRLGLRTLKAFPTATLGDQPFCAPSQRPTRAFGSFPPAASTPPTCGSTSRCETSSHVVAVG
jgi:2-dehydro-3-deoxyphosphogluconate aldolase/(4S)-4-hydroxy-2-oxoglutarate aldolase